MNRRIKKKAEKIRRKKIHKILDQVLDINGLEARSKKKTGYKPTAFLDMRGHVGTISVWIYKNGWDHEADTDYKAEIKMNGDLYGFDNIYSVIRDLDDLKRRLNV